MNLHRNARTTPGSRAAMVRRLAGESKAAVAAALGVDVKTVRKWAARFEAEGSVGTITSKNAFLGNSTSIAPRSVAPQSVGHDLPVRHSRTWNVATYATPGRFQHQVMSVGRDRCGPRRSGRR